MTCPHVHKDAPENAICEDCANTKEAHEDLEKTQLHIKNLKLMEICEEFKLAGNHSPQEVSTRKTEKPFGIGNFPPEGTSDPKTCAKCGHAKEHHGWSDFPGDNYCAVLNPEKGICGCKKFKEKK